MKFNISKNKIEKIGNNQNSIDNSLFHKKNQLKNLKNYPTVLKTFTTLYDSDYQVFQTDRHFGGLISLPIRMPISANSVSFTGNISLQEELVPYVRHSIIVKKPVLGEISGLYVANISTYSNNPVSQTGIFQENVNIIKITDSGFIIIGNTGSGEGTSSSGDGFVTKTSHPLFTIDGQRSIYSQDSSTSLILEKTGNNVYKFTVGAIVQFLFDVEELENVGTTNQEGDQEYTANFVESVITYYEYIDARVGVEYPAYRPVEFDIEAKLILSLPPNNIWENYSNYKS